MGFRVRVGFRVGVRVRVRVGVRVRVRVGVGVRVRDGSGLGLGLRLRLDRPRLLLRRRSAHSLRPARPHIAFWMAAVASAYDMPNWKGIGKVGRRWKVEGWKRG